MDLWSYPILFCGVAASWLGVPIVGAGALAAAGALAQSGRLNVWLVIAVAAGGAWTGGYGGYLIGARAGALLTDRPGRWRHQRHRALSTGKRFYRRWGPVAVFLTPTWVSGALRMPRRSFLIWNALAAIVSSLVTVFGAYAIASAILGRLSRGRVVGAVAIAVAVLAGFWVTRERRRRKSLDSGLGETWRVPPDS